MSKTTDSAVSRGSSVARVVATLLTAAGLLALRAGRRLIAWSALAIVVYTLVLTPLSVDNAGQFSPILYLLWVVGTSIALSRRSSVPAPGPVAAAAAQQA